jgi:hypothetical protein
MASSLAQTVVSLIESATGMRVFTIWEVDAEAVPDVRSWTSPRIARVAGSGFGARDFGELVGPELASQRFTVTNGVTAALPSQAFLRVSIEEQVNAVLFVGSRTLGIPSFQIPPDLCRRPGFLAEQLRRIRLSAPPFEADRLRDYCATIANGTR